MQRTLHAVMDRIGNMFAFCFQNRSGSPASSGLTSELCTALVQTHCRLVERKLQSTVGSHGGRQMDRVAVSSSLDCVGSLIVCCTTKAVSHIRQRETQMAQHALVIIQTVARGCSEVIKHNVDALY